MTDRIANLWDERTLFERDGDWPVRVDRFLEDGVSEKDVEAALMVGVVVLTSSGWAINRVCGVPAPGARSLSPPMTGS